jgi:Na+-transporting methylmalonyl-CoA/oxaloacetate decarboxylase gamma subunit
LDPSLTSGGIIATIGIGTVFFALVTLIGLVSAMAGLLAEPSPEPKASAAAPPAEPASGSGEDSAAEPDYQQIALSAYAYHRRATTRVKGSTPSTSWDVAGRIRELGRRTQS